jgi:hypothetical protein
MRMPTLIFLIPEFSGNAFCFSPFTIMLAVSSSYISFITFWYYPSIPGLFRVVIMKGYLILSKYFCIY